ncbi:MAG: MFS transporter [Candidatus Rokuibacteriota bacterium]
MARWVAAAGAFVVSLDSLLNIAFPAMAVAFDAPPEAMRWVIVGYVLTYALMSLVGGTLGDVVGHGRVFQVGAALGLASYLVCGLAPSFAALLAGRVVQGLGGGLVYGTAPGIVTLFSAPQARGRAVGFFNAAVGLASALGPALAGAMVETLGWRSVFLIRVPIGLALAVWAFASLPPGRLAPGYRLLRLADVGRASVLVACTLSFVANAGIFAIWLLAPFALVDMRGLSAGLAGTIFMLTPLTMAVAAPVAGRLSDRVSEGTLIVGGLALEAAGLWLIGQATATTSVPELAVAFAAAGLGLGLFQVPNMAVVMGAFGANQQGAAGGLAFLARTLGIVAGVFLLAEIFATRRLTVGFEAAFGQAFQVAAAGVMLGAVVGMLLVRRSFGRAAD